MGAQDMRGKRRIVVEEESIPSMEKVLLDPTKVTRGVPRFFATEEEAKEFAARQQGRWEIKRVQRRLYGNRTETVWRVRKYALD